jgi:hypothetical protein
VNSGTEITVFVPTVATRERALHLWKALDSVRMQRGIPVRLLVIANGGQCDKDLLSELTARNDITVLHSPLADFPNALRFGRRAVQTSYFAELDDDDELLPDALSRRLEFLERNPHLDAVVSNGWIRSKTGDEPSIPDIAAVRADPLRSLLHRNWLLPGAALFRSERVPADWFDTIPRCLEWTWIGLNLSLHSRVAFLEQPGVLHFSELPFSTYASRPCLAARAEAIRALFTLPLPADVRQHLRAKLADALHSVSDLHRSEGDARAAWKAHIESLTLPGGWRYLAYTRHLLRWPAAGPQRDQSRK